jgi:cysteinyl-tRNA synthetase
MGAPGISDSQQRWDDALRDDLNLPAAVGHLFDFVKDFNQKLEAGQASTAQREQALGFLAHVNQVLDVIAFPQAIDAEVERLIAERQAERDRRDFARADEIRQQLLAMGIQLDDTRGGTRWKRLK